MSFLKNNCSFIHMFWMNMYNKVNLQLPNFFETLNDNFLLLMNYSFYSLNYQHIRTNPMSFTIIFVYSHKIFVVFIVCPTVYRYKISHKTRNFTFNQCRIPNNYIDWMSICLILLRYHWNKIYIHKKQNRNNLINYGCYFCHAV